MSDEFPNGEANEARMQLVRTAQRAHRIEAVMVAFACSVGLILIVTIVVGTIRLQDYARTNKALGEQNSRLLESRAQADAFGIKAVSCVLDHIALHRITNQAVHDRLAAHDKVDPTPLSPLPPAPTAAQVEEDCAPFYRR